MPAAITKVGPERNTALMLLKAVVAAVLAGKYATYVLDSPTPFYAPMVALLVVDRTLFRSLWGSAQRVLAVASHSRETTSTTATAHRLLARKWVKS